MTTQSYSDFPILIPLVFPLTFIFLALVDDQAAETDNNESGSEDVDDFFMSREAEDLNSGSEHQPSVPSKRARSDSEDKVVPSRILPKKRPIYGETSSEDEAPQREEEEEESEGHTPVASTRKSTLLDLSKI